MKSSLSRYKRVGLACVALGSIVAAQVSGSDCEGATPVSLGNNLDLDTTCAFSAAGDLSPGGEARTSGAAARGSRRRGTLRCAR